MGLMAKEIEAKNEHQVFVVKIVRVSGDPLVFTRLKNGFLLTYCSSIIKGLPSWARQLEDDEEAKKNKMSNMRRRKRRMRNWLMIIPKNWRNIFKQMEVMECQRKLLSKIDLSFFEIVCGSLRRILI